MLWFLQLLKNSSLWDVSNFTYKLIYEMVKILAWILSSYPHFVNAWLTTWFNFSPSNGVICVLYWSRRRFVKKSLLLFIKSFLFALNTGQWTTKKIPCKLNLPPPPRLSSKTLQVFLHYSGKIMITIHALFYRRMFLSTVRSYLTPINHWDSKIWLGHLTIRLLWLKFKPCLFLWNTRKWFS